MKMKKLLAIALAALMLVSVLTACGNSASKPSDAPNTASTQPDDNKSEAPEQTPEAPETKYAVPTTEASVWQGKSIEDLQDEDISGKTLVYQFSGYCTDGRNSAILMDLFDDGFARTYQYSEGGEGAVAYIYYGYWTSVDDEYIFNAYSCYSYEGPSSEEAGVFTGDLATVDYSYQLENQDGQFAFGASICLGFANGGQYVRSVDVAGDGSVQYNDLASWTAAADSYFASLPAEG